MNYMEEQYGFDASFISEVPEYLKCMVCHLVLRQPIQIMRCGHRFCESCFERIKGYSEHLNTELCCPIDRETIDVYKVFDDTVISRVISILTVKCSKNDCKWTGYLKDLKTHEEQCQHRDTEVEYGYPKIHEVKTHEEECQHRNTEVEYGYPKIQEVEGDTTQILLNELSRRVEKCEATMMEKEKDDAFLKDNLEELKKCVSEKDEEVAALKLSNINIENEMKLMKTENEESRKKVEREIEVLTLKNRLLENKVDLLGNQLVEAKKLLEEKQQEMIAFKSEVEEMSKHNNLSQKAINEELKVLQDKVIDNCNMLKQKLDVGNEEIQLRNNWRNEVEKTKNDMKDIVSHVENIENIIFCDHPDNRNIKLKWMLHNYEYHFTVGKKVLSPVFYTQISGYCFQLHVSWAGEKKETLGVYLRLHRSCNYDKDLEPFRMQYTFEIPDNKGSMHCHTIACSTIDANREDCFTVHPNENMGRFGCGRKAMLSMPTLQNFIINDMLTIYCTLEHV